MPDINTKEFTAEVTTKVAAQYGDVEQASKIAETTVSETFDTLADNMAKGNKVHITGFGNFGSSDRASRQGHNPQTGEKIQIAASTVPSFKAAKKLKDAINGK